MGRIILITGGARSGKSTFAERKAKELGDKILYIATAIPFDDEMKDRIKKHQNSRPAYWKTWEGYRGVGKELEALGTGDKKYDGVLIDCITIMVTNIMLSHSEVDFDNVTPKELDCIEDDIKKEVEELIHGATHCDCDVIMVTNELGSGIVPENSMARAFRDLAGRANQMLGRCADELHLSVCGVPLRIK